MSIDIVMITTRTREQLLHQSMASLIDNATDVDAFQLTIVWDGELLAYGAHLPRPTSTLIINRQRYGASASRNIGAGSIPKYRRQKYVMFLDDDVYMCPGWDAKLLELATVKARCIISGYSHPYNIAEKVREHTATSFTNPRWVTLEFGVPLVVSTVCMMMPREIWDDVGPFDEPGGPGGSEDYALCMKAKAKGYGFAITEPQCVIHCGLTSSSGKQIVGFDQMVEQNHKLEVIHGIQGKVKYI